jgi:uncharacterized protein (TIGR04255 family)
VTTLPELARPPIAEVVYGMGFKPLPLLKSAHLGLFWSRYRERYVSAEDMVPVLDAPVAPGAVVLMPMMPRVWLVDATQTRLLQLQSDRLFMNWRQMKPQDEYPRFPVLFPEFTEFTQSFGQFLREQSIGELSPSSLELGYINQIYEKDGMKLPADVGQVFKPLVWNCDAYHRLSDPSDLGWRASFVRDATGIRLNVIAAMGKRQADGAPVLQLDIRAVSQYTGSSLEDGLRWYELAHQEVVLAFFDLTTESAQKALWS